MGCLFCKHKISSQSPDFRTLSLSSIPSSTAKFNKLSILSYNILADKFTSNKKFYYANPQHLKFNYRSSVVLQELENLNPDIICLQEVDHYRDFYKLKLKEKYELFEEEKYSMDADSIVVGLKKKKLEFISKKAIKFLNFVDSDYEIREDGNYKRFLKGNVALVIEARLVESEQKIIIVNTHLYWNPDDEDVKLYQFMQIIEYLEEQYDKEANIIICGDLNSLPESKLIDFIKTNNMKHGFYKNQEKIMKWNENISRNRKINLHSVYSRYKKTGYPKFTNYTERFKGVIDYIFYNSDSLLSPYQILKIPRLDKKGEKGIPNCNHPSDHLPVMAEFYFEKDDKFN